MSRLFWIRDWLSGNLHRTVRQMHGRYGEIVRVAPDELSFINPAAWSEIYGSSGGGVKALIRDPKWYANLTEGQDDIIVANEVDHSRFRKLLSPGLSEKSLRDNEHLIHNNISLLLTRLKGQMQTYGTVDMVKWYNFTTFDVIGDLVYGESFGCLQNSDYHPWLGVVLQNFKLSSYVALMERYSFVKKLVMIMLSKDLMEKRNMHLDVVRAKCAQRAESTREKKDIISTFPGKAMMTKEETEANLALLTVAGSETSATCLAAATYSLCKNRSSARILQTEILEAFIDEKNIMWDAVKKLPYLNAVIKEALRLYPPTPVGLPRRVVTDGIMVCGQIIPKDASFMPPCVTIAYISRPWFTSLSTVPTALLSISRSRIYSGPKDGSMTSILHPIGKKSFSLSSLDPTAASGRVLLTWRSVLYWLEWCGISSGIQRIRTRHSKTRKCTPFGKNHR